MHDPSFSAEKVMALGFKSPKAAASRLATKSAVISNARDVAVACSTAGDRDTSHPCSRSPVSLVLRAFAHCRGVLNQSELWGCMFGVYSSKRKNQSEKPSFRRKKVRKSYSGKGSSAVWAVARDSPHPGQDRDLPWFRDRQVSHRMSW